MSNTYNADKESRRLNDSVAVNINMKNRWSEVNDWCQALTSALAVVVIIFAFIFRIVMVDGTSMVPTLHDRDRLVISSLFCNPKNDDIVVLSTEGNNSHPIIKRVIGMDGQTVEIDYKNDVVKVYDKDSTTPKILDEPYINEKDLRWSLISVPQGIEGNEPQLYFDKNGRIEKAVYPVPEGCYFVMGDNRNDSKDSRFPDVGFIERDQIIGVALLRLFPFESFGFVN